MSAPFAKLPNWAEYGLIPVVNLVVAFLISGLVVVFAGENPLKAAYLMVSGAFGSGEGIGYTLYYATNFIFAGLAVAVAFHAGLFNIGVEGQAYVGGIGVAVAALTFDATLPWYLIFVLAIIGSMVMGALWALIPAWLQAYRGSHIVITTIMFNYISYSLMLWMLNKVFKPLGSMAPQSRTFGPGGELPKLDWLLAIFGLDNGNSPFNLTFLLALLAAFLVWVLIWRSRLGYEIRTLGFSPGAARYAGIYEKRIIIVTMLISGGLAGLLAINSIMGDQHRIQQEFVSGAGFVGIAVALMGRSHPIGIVLASVLFGMLYQGGAEIAFDMPNISRDMIVVIQGLVILFAGALEHLFRPSIVAAFARMRSGSAASTVTTGA
ncbi:ABC transporter permease [Rhizobium sp. TH2]|uniref:ABC transporter permease n=1 Tax=Rhizobium sp. TH2 TaxID=2775403 RepID=UPI002157F87E|nr:ABC transporter permease [Rhizobium sp. TH2]UVC08686.1 ABC transporter permease [Rhizobium sp. TH2]